MRITKYNKLFKWLLIKYKKRNAIKFAIKRDVNCNSIAKATLDYYKDDKSFVNELSYIQKKGYAAFPYDFYDYKKTISGIQADFDENGNLFVWVKDNKLYTDLVTYAQLLLEQNPSSPHCYFDDSFQVEKGDVFVDVGAAEGLISLGVIEKASKVYLIEGDAKWIPDLERTFKKYGDKVVIIPKYAGNKDTDEIITVDEILKNETRNCVIKIDVEGAERSVLEGMQQTMKKSNVKVALCTYHNFNDADEFKILMEKNGFMVSFSDGYMYKKQPPYFAKGLIRAIKMNDYGN